MTYEEYKSRMKAQGRKPVSFEDYAGQPEPKPFLARIWPIIEVPRCDAIPADYPGPMGVPVSFFDKIGNRNDGSSGFLVIGTIRPKLRGKDTYQRLVVVNLKYCDDRFQIYKKPDGTYCTAETPKGCATSCFRRCPQTEGRTGEGDGRWTRD